LGSRYRPVDNEFQLQALTVSRNDCGGKMTIRIVRLGSPRESDEGLRIGFEAGITAEWRKIMEIV